MSEAKRPHSRAPGLLRRAVLLAACIMAGVVVGAVGQLVDGSTHGYLAVPLWVAIAWLFVANPSECVPQGSAGEGGPDQTVTESDRSSPEANNR